MVVHRAPTKHPTRSQKRPSLQSGRPPTARRPRSTLSAQTTRTIIRGHHQLNKALYRAEAVGDAARVSDLHDQLERLGGLQLYQAASIQGQAGTRGGDSSVVLVDWLKQAPTKTPKTGHEASVAPQQQPPPPPPPPLPKRTLLEIGALSTKNACSTSGLFAAVTRIDLNAQGPGITQQDFMQRPLPRGGGGGDKFDCISLSLVLNYVPDARVRGEMLRRTTQFLQCRTEEDDGDGDDESSSSTPFPSLFLVLPAPCLLNSRYCNEERLTLMMASLGYVLLQYKQTAKLVYTLWQLRDAASKPEQSFGKVEVREGKGRNNFRVELVEEAAMVMATDARVSGER